MAVQLRHRRRQHGRAAREVRHRLRPGAEQADDIDLPLTHNGTVTGDPAAVGPAMLNVLKYLDIPQATAMAAMRSKVVVYAPDKSAWDYPATLTKNLGKETQFQVRVPVKPEEIKEEPKKKTDPKKP